METLLAKKEINSQELEQLIEAREAGKTDFLLVDVREDMEYAMGYIKGVNSLKPTSTFQTWGETLLSEIKDKTVIFTCRTGNRSGQVQQMFAQNGHQKVINHYGGIVSYRGEIAK